MTPERLATVYLGGRIEALRIVYDTATARPGQARPGQARPGFDAEKGSGSSRRPDRESG
ncbi:hypothetical protein [Streptosporangium sp. NPDC051022]|uniref:hypothetical protein n=1 Tax=Streptosporangium sp. NPDC051022 TaxID=3155752 RepID=UPI00343404AF